MENLCRICLQKDANIPIFESTGNEDNVHNKLALCVREKVEDIEGYPRNICKLCNGILESVSLFIKRYKESNKILVSGLVPKDDKEQSYEPIKIDAELKTEPNTDCGSDNVSETDTPLFHYELVMEEEPATGPILNKNNNRNGQRIKVDKSSATVIKKKLNVKLKQKDEQRVNVKKKYTISKFGSKTHEPDSLEAQNRAQCTICTKICASQYHLSKHMEHMHSDKKTLECNYCSKFFAFKGELVKHIRVVHTKTVGTPKIRIKKKKIPKLKEKKTDDAQKPLKLCDICGAVFALSEQLMAHKRKKHIDEPVQCPTCGRVSSSEYNLKRHMKRAHSNDKKFVCSTCSKAFAFQGELRSHIKSVHEAKKQPLKTFSCKICGKLYKCHKSVVVHERAVHTGERPSVCKVCNASFTHDEYLRSHMRLHTGETPYKCPICGRGYSQPCNMKSHLRTHRLADVDEATLRSLRPSYLKRLKKC